MLVRALLTLIEVQYLTRANVTPESSEIYDPFEINTWSCVLNELKYRSLNYIWTIEYRNHMSK